MLNFKRKRVLNPNLIKNVVSSVLMLNIFGGNVGQVNFASASQEKDIPEKIREEETSVPSFDGWQNSLNSNFLDPRTYTLSPDSSQENLKESQTNNDDKTDIPENDYNKERNPENIIVDDILKNWSLF